ncbi:MAG TPA: MBL fold metallo-hydrolase [Actinomycetota bacterium]|nr:MBL fold metallo-hydrolase [Actinomycetota bacterium]
MVRVEMLAASFGDCILVEFGKGTDLHRILIDAGLVGTYRSALKPRLAALGQGNPVPLDLLVVTHIDRDHICGILPLLREKQALVAPMDVWFNGRHHLEDDVLGSKDGEALGELLLKKKLPWNAAFEHRAVVVPEAGDLPVVPVGGAKLTLLSPYRDALHALAGEWDDTLGNWDEEPAEVAGAGAQPDDILGKRPPLASIDVQGVRDLADVPFEEDDAKPNGSSIAFLFEYEGKRVLFAADAHPSALLQSLGRLGDSRVKLDAFKLSHHGSMNNLSPELIEKVKCPRWLVSSNGGSFGHPHPETMARIATAPKAKTLCFNYASPYTTVWDDETVKKHLEYEVEYPAAGREGLVLEL